MREARSGAENRTHAHILGVVALVRFEFGQCRQRQRHCEHASKRAAGDLGDLGDVSASGRGGQRDWSENKQTRLGNQHTNAQSDESMLT